MGSHEFVPMHMNKCVQGKYKDAYCENCKHLSDVYWYIDPIMKQQEN